MEIRGLSNGLGLFNVEVRIMYRTKDGYEGVKSFPTMYVVGGNENDAIYNAIDIVNPMGHMNKGETITRYVVHVYNADPQSEYAPRSTSVAYGETK